MSRRRSVRCRICVYCFVSLGLIYANFEVCKEIFGLFAFSCVSKRTNMRTCSRCRSSLSLESFPLNRLAKDGRYHRCRECIKELQRIERQKKIEDGTAKYFYLTEEQKIESVKLYLSGVRTISIAKQFGVNRMQVTTVLKKAGVDVNHVNKQRKHKLINEDFFENINSPEKAYFLGLLWADGCAYQKLGKDKVAHQIVISLQERDGDILREFVSHIFENDKVLYLRRRLPPRQNQWSLRICSRKMFDDLAKLGMTPRKSFTCGWPTIDSELYPHFIRGCWDGDGSISFNNNSKNYASSIVGSPDFIQNLHEHFKSVGIDLHIFNKDRYSEPMMDAKTHGSFKTKQVLDYIYGPKEGPRLARKYQRYLDLCEVIRSKTSHESPA